MPRIFKGSESTLRLLIHTCNQEGKISDLKIALYTNDPSMAIEFTGGYTIEGNIVSLTVPNYAFGTMEDGVINYVAQGMIDDNTFLTERQSNYFLKTPANYTPTLIQYNTIADIYGLPNDSIVTFKGLVALSFAYGSGNWILFTDHTGAILLRNHQDFLAVGDECVVTATLRRTDTSYISVLFTASVEVLSSNNYVVMPSEAVELTNVDELYIPNENGYAEMKYLFVDGKVGDRLSEDFIRLETDASSQGNIGLRGDFKDWVEKLKQGDSIRVYMFTENSTNNFDVKDIVQLGTEGGSCNLGEGEIYLTANDVGFYELYAADDGYDGWSKFYVTLENGGAIKVFKASELLDTYNNGGQIDYGAYYYVGGQITEIEEINTEFGNATYVLDNGFKVYRGDWIDNNPFGEDQINVGAYIVVYGIIQDYKGILQFKAHSQVIAYQECEGGEIVSCNIQNSKWVRPSMADRAENGDIYIYPDEGFDAVGFIDLDPSDIYNEGYNDAKAEGILLEDKWVTPSMEDRDDNGLIVVDQSEGYDGLDRVVIDPSTIYNEGIEEGKNQGGGSGEGGECNIQNQKIISLNGEWDAYYPDEGYDGIYEVVVDAGQKAEEWREEGRNGVRDKLQSIEITENGRYSTEDQIMVNSLRYNGGYHTDTISTYDINRIEVTFKADTSESINGQGQVFILGGSLYGVDESGEDNACARAIQYAYGRIVGYWEGKWTDAVGTMDGEWLTITLDENGMTVKYPSYEGYMEYTHNNGDVNGGENIFPFIIGGLGRRKSLEDGNYSASLIEDSQFRGLIKEVKVNTNSMGEITYIPKNWGYGVWDRIVENTGEYLSALEPTEGEVTMNSEWERKYGEGWKEINVNIPTIQDSAKDYYYCPLILGDTGFGEAAKNWSANMVTFNNYDGGIIEDKLYVPTYSNKNEFRTKEKAKTVQRLPNDASVLGTMEFGAGVEYFVINEGKQFTNLTDLTIGPDMTTVNFGPSTFPILKRIWCFSETDNIDVYFSMGSYFYDSGTLYLKNHNQETEWRNSLPNGWTIVLI